MLERDFQAKLISELKERYKGCHILKNDANYKQGFPDLLILYKDKWVALECKKDSKASHQANQDYYIQELSEMSYASFIYPENKETILKELDVIFK